MCEAIRRISCANTIIAMTLATESLIIDSWCPNQVVPDVLQHRHRFPKVMVLPSFVSTPKWRKKLTKYAWCHVFFTSQSMVMQKKLRKAISYVARVQSFSWSGPASKGTMDCRLLKWFRTIPGVGSEVSLSNQILCASINSFSKNG